MSLYWVYDLPTWLFGVLTVIVFVAFGLGGLYLTRGWYDASTAMSTTPTTT